MYRVYKYCLSHVLIFDKKTNHIFNTFAEFINKFDEQKAREKQKKVTKSMVERHKLSRGEFVIGIPVLFEYAPEEVTYKDIENIFIGEFETWDKLKDFFAKIKEDSKPYFEEYGRDYDWVVIIGCCVKAKRGLNNWEKDFYAKRIEEEKTTERKSITEEKYLIDLLSEKMN